MIPHSANEINALCLKAARGAGLSWGVAEDAAAAVVWLQQNGISGASAFLSLLRIGAGQDWRLLPPTITGTNWIAPSEEPVCPLLLGIALCDFSKLPESDTGGKPVCLPTSHFPILLLPFIAKFAQISGQSIHVEGVGRRKITLGENGEIGRNDIAVFPTGTVRLAKGPVLDPSTFDDTFEVGLSDEEIAGLNFYALQTTVPSSEASRAGAGADINDSLD